MTVAVAPSPVRLKVMSAFGRLYVSGPSHRLAAPLPGAAYNERRQAYELSLTLESLRQLRERSGMSYGQFKQFCTPEVIAWAERAAASQRAVAEAQNKISAGWRPELPWEDNRAMTPAPDHAPAKQTYVIDGQRFWLYRTPYDHQEIMAAVGLLLDGSANLSQMGTGKTRAMCEVMAEQLRRGVIDLAIVVCPKGVMGTWTREAPIWSKDLRLHRLGYKAGRKTMDSVDKRRLWLTQWMKDLAAHSNRSAAPNVVVINYDVFYLLQQEIEALCHRYRVGMFPDEMHKLSNPQAKATKAMLHLAPWCAWRLGATGTPIKDKTAEGVWSQWYFVDLGITFGANAVQFNREWLDENPWSYEKTPKDGALEEIGHRIAMRSVRFLKKDCLDLPEKTYLQRYVDLTPEQQDAYESMKRDLLAELGDDDDKSTASAANQMTSILRLSQITSGFLPTDKGIVRFPKNPKLEALKEIIADEIDTQQIIVWAHFRADHDLLVQELAPWKPLLIRGGTTDQDEIEAAFLSGRCRLLIGQQQAMGVGRNLQAASLAIYFSQQFSIIDREQSEDRSHRSGSEIHEKISFLDLIASGTVDEDVCEALALKKSVQEIVVDLKRRLRGW